MPEKTGRWVRRQEKQLLKILNETGSKCEKDSPPPHCNEDLGLRWLPHWEYVTAAPSSLWAPLHARLWFFLHFSKHLSCMGVTTHYMRSTCLNVKYLYYLIVNISINAFFNLKTSVISILQLISLQSSKQHIENKTIRALQDLLKGKWEWLLKSYFLNQIQWLKGPRNPQSCIK